MSAIVPNGFFCEDYVAWDFKHWIISRGYKMQFPDLATSDLDKWWELEMNIRQIMGCLTMEERLQVIFFTDSDFVDPLNRYDNITETALPICQELRSEFSAYFRKRMAAGTLINANVHLYLSTRIKTRRRTAFDSVFKVVKRTFEQRSNYFDIRMRSLSGSATPLGNQGHYLDMLRHWAPSQKPLEPDWTEDVQSLCQYSDIAPRKTHGVFVDGHYVGTWVFKLMPSLTWPKTMEPFFNLTLPGLRVVLNMEPLAVVDEVQHEKSRHAKLSRNVDAEAIVGMEEHLERIRDLRSNRSIPFKAQAMVNVYAKSEDELDDKMEAVRAAIDSSGSRGWRPALPVSSIAYFNCATPGFGPWSGYNDYYHKIGDQNLAHIWPCGSTPTGELAEADWITGANHNNIIGGKLFAGSQPKDMLVIGSKGAGKSALTQTILLQSAHLFKFIAIVDEGFSWIETCRLLDPNSKPIIVKSNSGHIFNLFDTRGLALSPQHLRSAVALAQLIVGRSLDEDKHADRAAILSKAIKLIYDRAYRFWKKDNADLHYKACRRATMALMTAGEDFVDAVQIIKELEQTNPEAYGILEDKVTEEMAVATDRNEATSHFVRDVAFASWTPEMFPRLSHLYRELNSQKIQSHNPLYESLANQMERWLAGGEYGPIVDGVTNIDLGTVYVHRNSPLKVVHFELGEMRKAEDELKSVVGFLITNELRSVVQNMPRAIRKAVIIEEMTSFLRIPNASEIVIDYSERMRKYSCFLGYIFQQYSSLLKADPKVAEAIIGNAQTMFLLRNINREELNTLSARITLPEPVMDALQSFPLVESMKGREDQYAGFVYVERSDARPKFTIGRNVISKRLEQIVSSSGDVFDEKKKNIAMEVIE